MNVGFIGLGSMGSRIVTLLLDGGHHVTAWARRPASLEPFGGRCDRAASPAEVGARSELVGICVWDDHDVDEVLLGADGVFAGLPPLPCTARSRPRPAAVCMPRRIVAGSGWWMRR